MSRSLDPETTASLQNDDLTTIYNDVVSALCRSSEGLLEIEFLGKSHPLPPHCNVLVDGNSMATTKAKLVQAFMVARQVFLKYARQCPEEREQDLRDASAVILLLDPEHLTAANARKKIIRKRQFGSEKQLEELLKTEMRWLDGYLTSRLHRHTKSPTLWGHRRWLLEVWNGTGLKHDIRLSLKDVVLVAAELHPRNYYAWSHMRWLVQVFDAGPTKQNSTSRIVSDHSDITFVVKDWCLKNPSDISGFSFLLFCLFDVLPNGSLAQIRVCSSICDEVLRFAVSFRWTHESVWIFLRTAAASRYVSRAVRASFFQAIEGFSIQKDGQPVLQAAKQWCIKNQQSSEIE
ncbi:hypothetical protein BUE80_DR013872 [Diplocarpon rosae]|nr:hypothetical protein BUE80_DR013872 [Diplocarpon rosae]